MIVHMKVFSSHVPVSNRPTWEKKIHLIKERKWEGKVCRYDREKMDVEDEAKDKQQQLRYKQRWFQRFENIPGRICLLWMHLQHALINIFLVK